ncbi:MAG: stage II sporulation protein M [Acidobacteria bacterium]|nr:stage II sporulation protein M [Acidobacteriota bacterium]
MADSLIEKRKLSWKRLEELIDQARSVRDLRKLSRDEVRELGRSYRRAACDLAIARVESRDQRLVSYLNNLVIRAHGMIYRTESRGVRHIWDFYRYDFPVIFRRTFHYTFATSIIFLGISLCSFIATWRNDDFADFAYLPRPAVQSIKDNQSWWDDLNKEAPIGAAGIMANNIGVSFRVFALSIIPVAGTVYALMPSALQFGSINALIIKYRMTLKLWSFVVGHGVLEFTAIFIAGGAGLMIGLALLAPGERTRREALVERGAVAIKLLAGCIPLLVVAGCIEAFISPLPIHYGYRFAVSAATTVSLVAYLLKAGLPKAGPLKAERMARDNFKGVRQ